jgi:MFS family permease
VMYEQSYPLLVPGCVGIGLALGLTISPATTDALSTAAPCERGEASGLTQMTRQLGGSIGLATLAGVMVAIANATAALHRRHPVRDDGPNAPGAKASPTLAVLDRARELTAV